ncbi:hypothetical protein VNO77_32721 [Canavalia gladiata]|uniref:Uncharacterized protein n=1 Tax=Canavalia gladiata TaxID=3824 RepID=A0AAN9Q8E5_CANGL
MEEEKCRINLNNKSARDVMLKSPWYAEMCLRILVKCKNGCLLGGHKSHDSLVLVSSKAWWHAVAQEICHASLVVWDLDLRCGIAPPEKACVAGNKKLASPRIVVE